MTDVPASTATTATISIGATVSDSLEVAGDHDWFKLQLTAGQAVSVQLNGGSLTDPYLTIRNSAGAIIFQNDDGGAGVNSLIAFSPSVSGIYYIDVGAAQASLTGTYQLSVAPYTLPPVGTIDQFADWLTTGFWNGDRHRFDVTSGGTITVNLTGLTADGATVARAALDLWSDIIGVNFAEVSSGGQIVFDDVEDGTGAFSDGVWANGITSSATVNVSLSRLGSGPGITRVGLQTYIHEIGHALGLGHAGDYNGGTAFSRYPYEANYINDGAAISVMSYFDNGENTYYASQGFTNNLVVTPQIADIAAVAQLYGLSTTTRTGDTTYGFNNSSGREVFDASLHPGVAYTIFDSGGIDTLDYSGFASNQLINLNPETFSNVGPGVGNVSIARTVVIENAIGGSGSDTLIGNGAANVLTGNLGSDQLTGGAGPDTFFDTKAGHNGDTILDFHAGDRIVFSDATLAGFAFSLVGNTLTYTGGSLTLGGTPGATILASAAASGGVQLTLPTVEAGVARSGDFNGDNISDVLWRNDSGTITDWLGTASGGFSGNWDSAHIQATSDWHIAAAGDFNGDHRDDVLWRNDSGTVTDWLGTGSGGFFGNWDNAHIEATTDWQIAGVGDFNGDHLDDVLWRNADGSVTNWLGTGSGGFFGNWNNAHIQATTDWHIVGVGDFDGDGHSDILWRNADGSVTDWLGTASGGFNGNWDNAHFQVSLSWQVAAVGDFDGDHRSDILWRNADGSVTDWLGTDGGGFAGNWDNLHIQQTPDWQVAGVGDYNGDGRDDLLWRNADAWVTDWLGTATGSFVGNWNDAHLLQSTGWHIQLEHGLV